MTSDASKRATVVVDSPSVYTLDEIAISADELTTAADRLNESGAEFVSYPARSAGSPPRWVKLMGVNQLVRAAAVLRQQTAELSSIRLTVLGLVKRVTEYEDKVNLDNRRAAKMTRFDFIMMGIVGPDKWAAHISKRKGLDS